MKSAWPQSATHFSPITITERLSGKHSSAITDVKRASQQQKEGDAAPRAGLCPLLSLFSLCSPESPPSRSPPGAAAGSQTKLRSRHVLDT